MSNSYHPVTVTINNGCVVFNAGDFYYDSTIDNISSAFSDSNESINYDTYTDIVPSTTTSNHEWIAYNTNTFTYTDTENMPPATTASSYECASCGKEFCMEASRNQHCDDTGHSHLSKCDRCPRLSKTYDGSFNHMDSKNHFKYQCRQCYETWPDEEQRKEHEADDHYLCAACDKSFNNRQEIKQHLQSRIHNKTKISCPLCNKSYNTAGGVTQHVETGSCPKASNMDRNTLFAFVRENDPEGAVSKKLLDWHGEKSYQATDWAWDGSGYQCFYFCFKSFKTLDGLNQHLASPKHQQVLYHCPDKKCAKDFKILSGLINHLESETCGAMKFDKVQAGVERLIRGGRLLE